ncbi:hypothetical protein B296_00039003 [Ensete ventricosum]|uniref:Uncharacterized protein n=1 Tax=Ensete ventricosum TaxID=4639 RepID=A0A426ZGD2_ENSVE|nr:hypothetical protein B296_00039003 [Ensete ventricosum]
MPLTRQQKDLNITDLESSAMMSEELIDEMLEAFKTRMEDKFGLLAEFNLGRPSSPRKSQHGESSDRKQNASKRGEHATDSLYPRMRIDFPRWEDGHPTGWISHAEYYFRYHRTLDTSMVDIAANGQKVVADFFLPLDEYEVVLNIEWLSMLGDVSWNFSKLIMKFFSKGKQVILQGKRGSKVTIISTQHGEGTAENA